MKPSILFVSTSPNWPKTDGKRQRTWFILDVLTENYVVDYLFIGGNEELEQICLSGQPIRHLFHLEPVKDFCVGSKYPLWIMSPSKRKHTTDYRRTAQTFLENLCFSNQYAFIFFRYIDGCFSFKLPAEIKTVADVDDVYAEKIISFIKQQPFSLRKIKQLVLYLINEIRYRQIYRRINLLLVTKEEDRSRAGLFNSQLLPNLPFSYCERKVTADTGFKASIGFIGKLSYLPNASGLKWFLSEVWPDVVAVNPHLHFVIAGAGAPPVWLNKLIVQSTNVDFVGFVEDVSFFWEKVSISVVPVFYGGGTNIKIAESLSYGKPVLCNSFSAKGYSDEVKNGLVQVAVSAASWKEYIKRHFQHPSDLACLSAASISYAEKKYSIAEWKKGFVNKLQQMHKK